MQKPRSESLKIFKAILEEVPWETEEFAYESSKGMGWHYPDSGMPAETLIDIADANNYSHVHFANIFEAKFGIWASKKELTAIIFFDNEITFFEATTIGNLALHIHNIRIADLILEPLVHQVKCSRDHRSGESDNPFL